MYYYINIYAYIIYLFDINTNITVNGEDEAGDITIVNFPRKHVRVISEQSRNIRAELHSKFLKARQIGRVA